MNKIGIGIITCNRIEYLQRLAESLTPIEADELIIVNDGDDLSGHIESNKVFVYNNKPSKQGVGKSKNVALRALYNTGCEYIFLLEDDIVIKDKSVFEKYIEASIVSGIQHFNFAFHGNDNYNDDGSAAVKLKVEYSKDVAVCLYPNVYGAFSFYTKKCIEAAGFMDEYYYNAMEHVDHTNEIIKKGMHPPFRWFADIAGSENYITELDRDHSGSEIRKDETWVQNFHKAANYFAKKQGFDVRYPAQVSSRDEVITTLNTIKRTYGQKNSGH